jgi:hypothetical protein
MMFLACMEVPPFRVAGIASFVEDACCSDV